MAFDAASAAEGQNQTCEVTFKQESESHTSEISFRKDPSTAAATRSERASNPVPTEARGLPPPSSSSSSSSSHAPAPAPTSSKEAKRTTTPATATANVTPPVAANGGSKLRRLQASGLLGLGKRGDHSICRRAFEQTDLTSERPDTPGRAMRVHPEGGQGGAKGGAAHREKGRETEPGATGG